jgi:hypothetical protein
MPPIMSDGKYAVKAASPRVARILTAATARRYPETMARASAVAVLLLAAFLVSCRTGARAYLLVDDSSSAAFGGLSSVTAAATSAARGRGRRIELVRASDDKSITAAMDRAVADPLCRAVVALTASPVELGKYAAEHPGVLFAGYAEGQPGAPANLLRIAPAREGAFEEAGRMVGELATKGGKPAGPSVGILAVSPTAAGKREIEAVRRGLLAADPASAPLYRESRSPTDRAAAVRLLRELRAGGAAYYLLKTYGQTTACVEDLARDGGNAVVEDCGGSAACGDAVILSVETDWGRTLATVFEAMAPGGSAWSSPEVGEAWRVDERGGSGKRG